MALLNDAQKGKIAGINRRGEPARSWRMQLAQELFEGRYRPGQLRQTVRAICGGSKGSTPCCVLAVE
jgi:hypothetical protein